MAHMVTHMHSIKKFPAHSIHLTLTSHKTHSLNPQRNELNSSLCVFFQFEFFFVFYLEKFQSFLLKVSDKKEFYPEPKLLN